MTHDQWMDLSDAQQATLVAEICDWEYDYEDGTMVFTQDGDIVSLPWPSLDAMHEALKILTRGSQHGAYQFHLREVTGKRDMTDVQRNWAYTNPAAEQVAEAFVLTVKGEP